MNDMLNLYRFFTGEKVSSMRLMLYVLLGLAVSAAWRPLLFIYDLLFVFGGILFASMLNDYYDFKLLGEINTIGRMIEKKKIPEKRLFWLIWLPCILPFALFYPMLTAGASSLSMGMLASSFFLSLCYCAPPLRLKKRFFFGVITPPTGIYLLFLQAVLLVKMPGLIQWVICGMVFLFSWYLDFIHLANDSVNANEISKVSGHTALEAAKAIGVFGIICALAIIPISNLGFAPLVFWITRLMTIWKAKPEDLSSLRRSLFSRIYCIEEFAVYAIFAICFMDK